MSSPAGWGQRPALDGVRTLAVYLVVLFHAGLGWIDGGFIGVDLFFVLSGFLVSTILYGELEARGRIDLLRFYDRRVRRLLPAAVLLVVVASAVGVLVLSASERAPMAGDATAALLYFANWWFMLQANDYFGSTVVDSSLFLHFWSLSIEEQFYFVFPVLLLVLVRLNRRWRHAAPVVLVALLVASLAAQLWWAGVDPNHAYYGTETRFYQLLAGVVLALALHRWRVSERPVPFPGWVSPVVTVLATVGMVVAATSLVELTPAWRGIVATVLAVALVGALSGPVPHAAARPFTWPPVVYLGRISYGTYLWHWPVVVLLQQAIDPPAWQFALLVTVTSTAFASASYHMLETPIRSRRVVGPQRVRVLVAGLGASVLAATLVVPQVMATEQPVALKDAGLLENGPENVAGPPPDDVDWAEFGSYREAPVRVCEPSEIAECRLVTGQDGPNVFVLGDSQAREMEPTLRMLAEEHEFNLTLLSLDACSWAEDVHNLVVGMGLRTACEDVRSGFWETLLEREPIDVLLLLQQDRSVPLFDGTISDSIEGEPVRDEAAFFLERTNATLDRLDGTDVRTLIVRSLWLPPEDADPTGSLSGARDVAQCRVPISDDTSPLDAAYVAAAASRERVWSVDLNPIFCPNAPLCDPVLEGVPVWRDSRHVSAALQERKRDEIWATLRDSGAFAGTGGDVDASASGS